MIYFYTIIALITAIGVTWHLLTKKYLNPYKLIFVFGKKGSGKTTLLVKKALEYKSNGWQVFSTVPIPGTYKIEYTDIGFKMFPPQSLVIVDEVGMCWDNRNFKNFKPETRDFFKLQRHYKCCVILASQTFDVDKKIRDLSDEMYLVEKKLRVYSVAKRVIKKLCIVEASGESPSRIDENLMIDSPLFFWAGSRIFTLIPHWTKYYDSFQAPQLPETANIYIPELPDDKIFSRKPLRLRGTLRTPKNRQQHNKHNRDKETW